MISLQKPTCPYPAALSRGNYKHTRNKTSLKECSFGKCIYCESSVSHVYYGDVEHLIPKSIKPELEYDWDNLGYVCALCNGAKGNKYDEQLEIINPYTENPSHHLTAAGSVIYPLRGSERGELTIHDVDLNRIDLIQRRQDLIDRINRAVVACFRSSNGRLKSMALESLRSEANSNKEYSFVVKHFLDSQSI